MATENSGSALPEQLEALRGRVPTVTCPQCGFEFPPGTVVIAGELIDPIVESGGRSLHPGTCSRSPNWGTGPRGLFQQAPSSYQLPAARDGGKKGRR